MYCFMHVVYSPSEKLYKKSITTHKKSVEDNCLPMHENKKGFPGKLLFL